jgi:hypothetical protein
LVFRHGYDKLERLLIAQKCQILYSRHFPKEQIQTVDIKKMLYDSNHWKNFTTIECKRYMQQFDMAEREISNQKIQNLKKTDHNYYVAATFVDEQCEKYYRGDCVIKNQIFFGQNTFGAVKKNSAIAFEDSCSFGDFCVFNLKFLDASGVMIDNDFDKFFGVRNKSKVCGFIDWEQRKKFIERIHHEDVFNTH